MTEPSQYFKGRTVQEQMNEVIGYVDTRAAEVATTAIASDVAQVHQDMLDADADAQAAAASAAAAAGTLANAVKKTGETSQNIAGDIAVAGTLSGGVVTGTQVTVPTPVNNTDAVNKKYVDDQDALDVHLAGDQTVANVKTFTSSPIVPTPSGNDNSTKAATTAFIAATPQIVHTSGNETINGVKTFNKEQNIIQAASFSALGWTDLYKRTDSSLVQMLIGFAGASIVIARVSDTAINTKILSSNTRPYTQPMFKLATDQNGVKHVFFNATYGSWMNFKLILNYTGSLFYGFTGIETVGTTNMTEPVVGDNWTAVVGSTDFEYTR